MSDEPMGIESYEAAMTELTEIVSQLEAGGLTLEQTLALFERGQNLAAVCARLLDEAQLRVEQLREAGGQYMTGPLDEN